MTRRRPCLIEDVVEVVVILQGHTSILVVFIGEEKAEVERRPYFPFGEFAPHHLRAREV